MLSQCIPRQQKSTSKLAEEFKVRLGNHQTTSEQSVKYLNVIIHEKLFMVITSVTYSNKGSFCS